VVEFKLVICYNSLLLGASGAVFIAHVVCHQISI
jgi:hypothetical protein